MKDITMQTIHIDVKDIYVSNVLTMLKSMKDVMIDKINLDTPSGIQDEEDLMKLQANSMNETWDNDEDKAWDEL